MARVRVLAVVGLTALGILSGLASAASAATTCKTVAHVHHGKRLVVIRRVVHGKRVHIKVWRAYTTTQHVKMCETATLSLSQHSVPSTGGSVAIRYASTNASRCTLSSSPAFWTGANPTPAACHGTYTATIPAAASKRQWTFHFTAKNRFGQSVSVTQTLVAQAPMQQLPIIPYPSTNWSGYAVEGSSLGAIEGTFNVPTLAASATETDTSEWVGIDGVSNSALIQAGIHEQFNPTLGGVVIWAWWEMLPSPETLIGSMVVSRGDQVTVQVAKASGTTWGISVRDNTTGQSFGTQQTYTGPGTSAEWIVEAPSLVGGGTVTLGDYSPAVTFSGLGVNGTQVGFDQLFMVQGGLVVSSPSLLDPNGFSVAYGPAAPPAP